MKLYIRNFFPVLYSFEKSKWRRFVEQMCMYHNYLQVVFSESGHKRWMMALKLLTDLTLQSFLLAVFFNVQVTPVYPALMTVSLVQHVFDTNQCVCVFCFV